LFLLLVLTAGTALAGAEGEHHRGFSLKEHGFYIANFILFIAMFVWFARKPIREMLKARSEAFASRLNDARVKYEATQASLTEAKARVDMMEMEAAALLQRLGKEGQRLKETICARAEEESEKIRKAAETALINDRTRMEQRFQAEVALESLELAEQQLKTRWRQLPHQKFMRLFVSQLSGTVGADGGE